MACEENKCLECGMHRDKGMCRWCKREKALEELKAMLAQLNNIFPGDEELSLGMAAVDLALLKLIEKIVEILDERSNH